MTTFMVIVSIFASQGVLRLVEAFCVLELWVSCLIAGISVVLIQTGLFMWKEKS